MAKKKKTQLKPVARPFATASVPKKVDPVPEEVQEVQEEPPILDNNVDGKGDVAVVSDEVKALMEEEQVLQGLVDKLQDKTEKEINRNVKVRDYDPFSYYLWNRKPHVGWADRRHLSTIDDCQRL